MSQNQDYNLFDPETDHNRVNSYSDRDYAEGKVFRKLSNGLTIEEKINLTVELHNNNYFLEQPVESLAHVDKRIRPLQRVTKQYLHNMRSTKNLNKKLSWVIQNKEEDFCREFTANLANKNFSSVKFAQLAAREIFKTHKQAEYKGNQATVSSQVVDGRRIKVVNKREETALTQQILQTQQIQIFDFIETAKLKLKERATIDLITENSSQNVKERQRKIKANSVSIQFARDAFENEADTVAK